MADLLTPLDRLNGLTARIQTLRRILLPLLKNTDQSDIPAIDAEACHLLLQLIEDDLAILKYDLAGDPAPVCGE